MGNETTINLPNEFVRNIIKSEKTNKRVEYIKDFFYNNTNASVIKDLEDMDNILTNDKVILIAIDLLYNAICFAEYTEDNKTEIIKNFCSWIGNTDKTQQYIENKLNEWLDI